MKLKLLATLCLALCITCFVRAQTSVSDMVKEWERAKAYTREYLDSMPESGYALKPKPEMRSFAEQMLHLTDANYGFASAATGVKSP
ncbi:MAG TPA: DinB family protein, partial [Chitinophagaceae bacterium]|nr:DinB family protein [Chitinophagaceae bacterium]